MRERRVVLCLVAGYEKQINKIMATIQDKARAFIATKLNVSENEVTPEKHLFNDLGADSLDVVELIMILEREFNVKFSEEETANIKTVGDVYALIEIYTKKS